MSLLCSSNATIDNYRCYFTASARAPHKMNSRLATTCLYATSTTVAFVAPTRGMITRLSSVHTNGYCTARDGAAPRLQWLLPWLQSTPTAIHSRCVDSRRNRRSLSISSGSGAEEPLPQDLGEMFDVYLPPESLTVLTEPPRPAGFTKPRGLVHAKGDWHRSIHIWLYNSKGEVVMQRRAAGKDTYPGMWDASVGGHFSAGESSLETAIKESREELGIDCDDKSLKFICTVATSASGSAPQFGDFICNEYKDIYLLRYDGPVEELQYSPSEVDDVKLVPVGQLHEIYEAQDPTYIPRPSYYLEPLVKAIKEATR